MTPKQKYQYDLEHCGYQHDSAQQFAVDKLDVLYHQLLEYVSSPVKKPNFFAKILGQAPKVLPPQGLYFWGGVGRGKTYLMDLFFDALPHSKKSRMHFHRFMLRVHDELGSLQNTSDPLEVVADRLKQEADIICFDEFFVSDITDAMILGTLFQALFARNMVLVATSNIPPKDLYRNGLQRARFLPAIELIEKNCIEVNVDSGVDYRLRTLQQAEIYHYPLDNQAAHNLNHYYLQLSRDECQQVQSIEVNHRNIEVMGVCDGVLLISFEQLCESARSQSDYIEISRLYHTVLVAGVKQMSRNNDDAARRFIAMVDEFYDRNVTLIISAEVKLEDLYLQGQLEFEFRRCQSRLVEMQSVDYLANEHLS
ncbi:MULTISPECIES: cell division protein ZapE [Vibrio]|uniref:Cell division protein ZapE n=1 Tax=Vibrio algicola TaxID=2662262 RepID=A0A5Q0TG59_9VIBR|nr:MULTISPECIES: cell division protein ZapE [Vibrio]MBD1577215.1 cell division protein ZapE [Vibrio sp. S11_S32]